MKEYQTLDKLEEKVYEVNNSYSEYEIDYEVKKFFEELLSRKRDDPFEGGLQAGGIIFPDKAAFKISEDDGRATHIHNYEAVAQYMDGEKKFSGTDTMGNIYARENDPHSWLTINQYGFEIRILIGKENLIIIFNTNNDDITTFQYKVIEKFNKYARLSHEKELLSYVSINYLTRNDKFITNDEIMNENLFDELEDLINSKMEDIRRL